MMSTHSGSMMEQVMHVVGRMCIRLLRNFSNEVVEDNLFEYAA